MEEQFILRVPPAVAERIEKLLNESSSSSEDSNLDLSFSEDGRTGTFVIGNDRFSASLLDLPTVVESYKTYDDNVLIKTADIGQLFEGSSSNLLWQLIMVREEGDNITDPAEYKHGLTPPMRDARRRRFRREPDLNPEVVRRVERDLQSIMAGGTAESINVEMAEARRGENPGGGTEKKAVSTKANPAEGGAVAGDPDDSDSDETDESM
ncbi:hypothetical protein M569_14836 [Genlisea aurea]|uniref:TAFII55 protein conserved region domain-containing protein n=1 Tax=Genlisea aurea TaxID=192259 RepID=S8DKE5_9LAMI|nr:hypothetical protein M569_14836 [Genlisea aurea]